MSNIEHFDNSSKVIKLQNHLMIKCSFSYNYSIDLEIYPRIKHYIFSKHGSNDSTKLFLYFLSCKTSKMTCKIMTSYLSCKLEAKILLKNAWFDFTDKS